MHLEYKDKFSTFKYMYIRLDNFLALFLNEVSKYVAVWKVAKIILTLSHVKSGVERGFSVNNEALKVNMQEKSLVSLHLIYYDHLISSSSQEKLSDYTISASLRKSCSCAYARSREATEVKKEERKGN